MKKYLLLLLLVGCASNPPLPELSFTQAMLNGCKHLGANYSTNDPEWVRSIGGNAYVTMPKGIYAMACPAERQ